MMIKCAVFDVDSTLTSGIGQPVVPSVVRAIHQLQEKGIKIVIASGRTPQAIPAIEGLIEPDYYVSPNGSLVMDKEFNILYQLPIPRQAFMEMTEYCRVNKLGLMWKYPFGCYVIFENEITDSLNLTTTFAYVGFPEDPDAVPVAGALLCSPDQYRQAEKDMGQYFDFIDGGYVLYDIDQKGVSKSTGLEQLLKIIGISPQECISFGDSDNDITMLQYCGIGVAMGNGYESAKAAADYVTCDAGDDGIEKALKHFGIL